MEHGLRALRASQGLAISAGLFKCVTVVKFIKGKRICGKLEVQKLNPVLISAQCCVRSNVS